MTPKHRFVLSETLIGKDGLKVCDQWDTIFDVKHCESMVKFKLNYYLSLEGGVIEGNKVTFHYPHLLQGTCLVLERELYKFECLLRDLI